MGSEEEKVLSQADVDALVALVPDKPRASASRPKVEEHVKPVSVGNVRTDTSTPGVTSPQKSSTVELDVLQKALTDLTKQVAKLTNAIQRIDILEEKTEQLARALSQSPNNIQPSEGVIREIQAQLKEVSSNLKNKHDLRDIFQCATCKSKSTVAFYTKCTSCGHEKWFGWWPNKKSS
jgi:hypothetical protein